MSPVLRCSMRTAGVDGDPLPERIFYTIRNVRKNLYRLQCSHEIYACKLREALKFLQLIIVEGESVACRAMRKLTK